MKSTLIADFNANAQEVTQYLIFLKRVDQDLIKLTMKKDKTKSIDLSLKNTLMATGFVLLYNLVESTMRSGIQAIFDELKDKKISFDDVNQQVKKIVINNLKDKDNKSTDEILSQVEVISLDIISVTFNSDRLFSGNIDGRKIKKIAEMYGFSCKTNAKKTRNGEDLQRIKDHRKDLTHGFKSFGEVGKDITANELFEIQRKVICYLREILTNIESYISNQEYLKDR
ncbi:MAE_28990/MAE_18760 family HEPN-like nuclease [Cylindrospermopsis raciborskii]|uniref:MAE_28990/MAE_18760 family HEPN-like nuclease n=1 Tax=Cylindrospermopsis raciborskii TaxID=77022 RepID=UPI000C1C52C2|nr:MAE_28990/MAE_18760 family HEPN-like nuclease [Cylindrospermopsis raciborskii]MCZ2202874.1 MAE_28990/MAE_18760 family HEPN-like nuclease [Cylindrospermopsis raciborskii PAMP2012]MCZ2207268.1 MAE_28990/MAE_18760 family HEPN-like nuclease [Cylindrospermopsis raciborskii PAMP2011]